MNVIEFIVPLFFVKRVEIKPEKDCNNLIQNAVCLTSTERNSKFNESILLKEILHI